MIDKAIGVIPPRNELNSFSEKITGDFKDKKSDFESYLSRLKSKDDQALGGNKKRAQDEPRSERKLTAQTEKPKKDERAERSEEQGEKKKVRNKLEDEMVLMSMASIENVIKTPDTEENLDSLEIANFIPETNPAIAEGSEDLAEGLGLEESMALRQQQLAITPGETEAHVAMSDINESSETMPSGISQNGEVNAEVLPMENSKVLDALNREQLFQKLEAMTQTEASPVDEMETALEGINTEKNTQVKSDSMVSSEASQKLVASLETENKSSDHNFDQEDQSSFSDKESSSQLASAHQQPGLKEFSLRPAEAAIAPQNPTAVNTETAETNVSEILKQAQYLVKQGGGEVTVKMTPEGMGEVHLKVMLENGKMNVEMNAHDKTAQKLIQDNLSDLRSSLAAHQISVEHVTLNNKLTTVESMQKSNDSQNFTDSRQFSDGGANQFANQSQQNRQQHQQSSHRFNYEMPQAAPLAQSEIKKAVAHRVYQANKAQSLNAVA